ncbi:MAG: translation initiation factor IF-2 N-terminal domain-containing protein, partial [Syntrophobacterales bacterium]|nr:translation initiation factor IF-2 N-terminal domain-containing protein [Syntrophobacterales bacterium]
MSKIRVYELAKDLSIENNDLIARLEKLGIAVKAHSSSLEESDVERVRKEFALGEKNAIVEKRVKKTVIRRRAIRQQVPEAEETSDELQPETVPKEAIKETKEELAEILEKDTLVEKFIPEEKTISKEVPAEDRGKEKGSERKEGAVKPERKPQKAKIVRKALREEPKKILPEEEVHPEQEKKEPAPPKDKLAHKAKKPVKVVVGEEWRSKKTFAKKQPEEQPFDRKRKRTKKKRYTSERRNWKEERTITSVMKATEITTPKAIKRRIKVEEAIRISDLAKKMGIKAGELIGKLVSLDMMVTINQSIDIDAATLVAGEFGYQVESVGVEYGDIMHREEPLSENLKPRAP